MSADPDRLPDEQPKAPENRVGLHVTYEGAEAVWLELDAGQDLAQLIEGLGTIFNAEAETFGVQLRLWHMEGGEWKAVGVPDEYAPNPSAPIGKFLGLEEMHSVTLAYEAPPIRGTA